VQPYVIRQGDFLLKLATRFGFDADEVWNDDKNADLRQQRPDPNILLPGEMFYIPDSTETDPMPVITGTTNVFTPRPPTVTIICKFGGNDSTTYASKAYTITELPEMTGLATDSEGVGNVEVPVSLDTATLVFSDTAESFTLCVGDLDPHDTPSGAQQRLTTLGFPLPDEPDEHDLRCALAMFQCARGLDPTGDLDDQTAAKLKDEHGL
jgi:hypothetical protein